MAALQGQVTPKGSREKGVHFSLCAPSKENGGNFAKTNMAFHFNLASSKSHDVVKDHGKNGDISESNHQIPPVKHK